MLCTGVSIYCLPNIRKPWVLVFEPHPWGRGALRVAEESAVLILMRQPMPGELKFLDGSVVHYCFTFETEARLIEYERDIGGGEDPITTALELTRTSINRVLDEVRGKQEQKRKRERRRVASRVELVTNEDES